MILHLVRVFYGLLLAAGIGGLWWLAPPDAEPIAGVILTIVAYGPLLFFIPAVVSGDGRQLSWLCFVLMFYFCFYVVHAFYPPPANYLAWLRLFLLCSLFIAAMLAIRQEKRIQAAS